MSILSGFLKERIYKMIDGNYKKVSRDTNAETVYFDDGKNLNDKLDYEISQIDQRITEAEEKCDSSMDDLKDILTGTVLWEYDSSVDIQYKNTGIETIDISDIGNYDYFDFIYGDGYTLRCKKNRDDAMLISRALPYIANTNTSNSYKLYPGSIFSQIIVYFNYKQSSTKIIENQINIRRGIMWNTSFGATKYQWFGTYWIYQYIDFRNKKYFSSGGYADNKNTDMRTYNYSTILSGLNMLELNSVISPVFVTKIIGYKNLITTPDEPPLPSD